MRSVLTAGGAVPHAGSDRPCLFGHGHVTWHGLTLANLNPRPRQWPYHGGTAMVMTMPPTRPSPQAPSGFAVFMPMPPPSVTTCGASRAHVGGQTSLVVPDASSEGVRLATSRLCGARVRWTRDYGASLYMYTTMAAYTTII